MLSAMLLKLCMSDCLERLCRERYKKERKSVKRRDRVR